MKYLIDKLLYVFFVLVEVFLVLRFILKLFGANTTNDFVTWVYQMSGTLLDPFRGIFPTHVFPSGSVLEFSTIFAMIIYAVIVLLLAFIVNALSTPLTAKK